MTFQSLPAALRAAAQGIYALEAATGLIVASPARHPSSSVMPLPGSTSVTSGSCVKQFFTPPDDASSPPAPESS
jgi:hypothetical protein